MSVVTVKTRLAAIQAAISGVGRAYPQAPLSLPGSDLPAFVTYTGQATNDWRITGSDVDSETRIYLMRLYVAPLQQGVPGEMERLCQPFFASVRDAFGARPGLEILNGVLTATLLGDGGPAVMAYGSVQYIGIEFRLQVIELVEVSYADYD